MRNALMILHGLGDNLLIFPVIYRFYIKNGSDKIDVVLLENGSESFWKNINFVENVHVIKSGKRHPQYWNPALFLFHDYFYFLKKAHELLKSSRQKYRLTFLKINLLPNFLEKLLFANKDRHKATKAGNELGVNPVNEILRLEDFTKYKIDQNKFQSFLKRNSVELKKYIAVHRKSFDKNKNISKNQITKLARGNPSINFVIIMDKKTFQEEKDEEGENIHLKNVHYTNDCGFDIWDLYLILKNARANIVIDSSMLHLSQFTNTPTLGIFKHKYRPDWIVPRANNIAYLEVKNENEELEALKSFIINNQ